MGYCMKYRCECCLTEDGFCGALNDTTFRDGKCHFHKTRHDGKNLYDEERKKKKDEA